MPWYHAQSLTQNGSGNRSALAPTTPPSDFVYVPVWRNGQHQIPHRKSTIIIFFIVISFLNLICFFNRETFRKYMTSALVRQANLIGESPCNDTMDADDRP
jgi:hypothetical protein